MRGIPAIVAIAAICAYPTGALADSSESFRVSGPPSSSGTELPPYLQCVPYARQLSGIQIYGDAHTWWDQAAGRYERGQVPRVGAVMAFQPYRGMTLGHVAAVSRVIDSRTVLLDHANWSPIEGRRGQIERNVRAVDVSPANDWSQVRVWYDPIQGLGTTPWPVRGFIYSQRSSVPETRLAAVQSPPPAPSATRRMASAMPSREFLTAFAGIEATVPRASKPAAYRTSPSRPAITAPQRKDLSQRGETSNAPRDAIAAAVALYGN